MNVLITVAFLSVFKSSPDTNLIPLTKEIERLQVYLLPPPEYNNPDTCFHYSELLIVSINKFGRVNELMLNDHAPDWLRRDLEKRILDKQINFKKLDSLAIRSGVRNCKLVFPLVIESDNFPCVKTQPQSLPEADFYTVKGKPISGNIIFRDKLVFLWFTKFRH